MRKMRLQDRTPIVPWRLKLNWTTLVALVALSASMVGAAPENYDFKLKMSQDKELCPAITKVLSAEYNDIWIQRAPRHEWFIRWEPLDSLGEQFRNEPALIDRDCHKNRWAQFDIDNDGHTELVIKQSRCLGGILSDTLYIFQSEEARENIYQFLMDPFAPSSSLIGTIDNRDRYELKKLPPFKDKQGREQLYAIEEGALFIHPFIFGGHAYLSVHDLGAWHVIARYRRGEKHLRQLEDVCYVQRRKR